MTLVELNNRKIELHEQLSQINEQIRDLRVAQFEVALGDLVLYKGEIYKVTNHKFFDWSDENAKLWLDGVKKRKDGSFGTRHVHLYSDWSKL